MLFLLVELVVEFAEFLFELEFFELFLFELLKFEGSLLEELLEVDFL